MTFDPRTPDHLAGLTAYYNTRNWHYLYAGEFIADNGGVDNFRECQTFDSGP
ncbi:hypothetical protein [Streptomyces sp. SID12488]|uniref:beta-xylosidase family glycoside hydrolase n=1 Tax=Streptomyces sp. SID12488 TaxID=2706040 RepID=UPI0031BBB36F